LSYRSKNHHFVPKVLQKQFAAEEGTIWYAARRPDGAFDRPQMRKFKDAFQRRNLYTVHVGDTPTDVVEKEFYGEIDNYLGRLLPKISEAFKNGRVPTFTGKPLESLRRVVIEMAKRTPEFTKAYNDFEIGRELVLSVLASERAAEEPKEREKLLAELEKPDRLKEIGRSIRVRAAIGRSQVIEDALDGLSVRWAVSKTQHSYILSSLMAYRIGNGGSNGLSNPNAEIWMPIGPKAALVLLRDPNNRIPLKVSESSENIRQLNEYAASNSQQIASHSRKLIESLTGKRAIEPHFTPASSPPQDQTAARH
jgi:hypothetical protein